jgi:hypothetical protein
VKHEIHLWRFNTYVKSAQNNNILKEEKKKSQNSSLIGVQDEQTSFLIELVYNCRKFDTDVMFFKQNKNEILLCFNEAQ